MDPTLYKIDDTPKSFFNPLDKDIQVEYRHENNLVDLINIPSLKISTHPTYIANVLVKHLIDAIVNDRELGLQSPELLRKIEQEVLV